MSKVRPWLGLYLWMNKERQEDFAEIWKSEKLEAKQRDAKEQEGAKVIRMSQSNKR